ncbi:tryptophan 2,3-dioxygenase [Sinimarinibacterium sp. CAU 1509]|uniref:tryptophan 2,3-dioxygenase n=1 Tax=Sinimarinibacterium sp. CAU 1509 TaxID=2562283 RepID=UPI0010AB8941|nr:tryptophan 2,3-dioxygenase family protein [Sinimarinibacterium sp. CAU 1509]TJY61120.1 tryptophan 2,3-dioxygenase [Sinimarinibacterium sp. CAU 1509]
MSTPPLTYGRYLQIEALLKLQQPLSDGPEHDETLFIIIHQVYELWFKQLLHELDALNAALDAARTMAALATLKRMLTILKTLVAQVDVLETMTPLSFNAFRARLDASSGFQSAQFRLLEFRLGHKRPGMLTHYGEDGAAGAQLDAALRAPALYDHLLGYLHAQGHAVPPSLLSRDFCQPYAGSSAMQDLLVSLYRHDDPAAQVCERLVDLDEGLQEWRYRHVKMVERTIGSKPGTGGSSGVEYLRATLFQPLFPDLWAIRARL